MNYKEFPKDVNPGERILLDDGKLIFEVTEIGRIFNYRVKLKIFLKIFLNIQN